MNIFQLDWPARVRFDMLFDVNVLAPELDATATLVKLLLANVLPELSDIVSDPATLCMLWDTTPFSARVQFWFTVWVSTNPVLISMLPALLLLMWTFVMFVLICPPAIAPSSVRLVTESTLLCVCERKSELISASLITFEFVIDKYLSKVEPCM